MSELNEFAQFSTDELDAAYGAVLTRYPELSGEALKRRVLRVCKIIRYANNPRNWM
jgi:hypothetical protein